MTGFARFFIFLIIATPIVYLIASYYNGQDGLENIKALFNRDQVTENITDKSSAIDPTPSKGDVKTPMDLSTALKKIDSLQSELENCKSKGN